MKIRFRTRIKFKNLAGFTIPFDAKQDLVLRIGTFPTGDFRIKISRATGINIFRTIEEAPAGCFPIPKI